MSTTCTSSRFNRYSIRQLGLIVSFTFVAVTAPMARGQNQSDIAPIMIASTAEPADLARALPDSPGASLASSSSVEASADSWQFGLGAKSDVDLAKHEASPTEKYILPGQRAPRLTTGDKVQLGLIHGVSPFSIAGWFVSAGYSHLIDSSPNYGVDKGAFGERLGAAALRGYSEEVFTDSIMAPVFHQDPRYYKLGPSHTLVRRTAYAVSRVLVTRNDNGRSAPNYSLVTGNLMAAALTNAYYPDVNRSFGQTATTFGAAMGGAAFSYFASEFVSGALEAIHLKESRN